MVDRREVTIEADHSLPTERAGGFRTAQWNLVFLAAQSQAPDSQATQLKADKEIHALCEALIAGKDGQIHETGVPTHLPKLRQ